MTVERSPAFSLSSSRAVWLAIGGVLFAGALYIALNFFEIVEQAEWVGAEGEARTDPYYAMRKLLEHMGARTVPVKQFSELDTLPRNATLILGDRRLARMSPTRVANIVAWVKSGGHLVVEAEQPKLDDPLLAAFGLKHIGLIWTAKGMRERNDNPAGKTDDGDNEEEPGFNAESLPEDDGKAARPGRLKLPMTRGNAVNVVEFPDGARFKMVFVPYQNLRFVRARPDALALRDRIGLRLVAFAEGAGRVTAISNFDFMAGRAIGRQDHAEFLWRVVANRSADTEADKVNAQPLVVLALRSGEGGLLKWLRDQAWMVLWALLALLVAWLARMVSRFGPLLPELPAARLSLAEHFTAMGRYLGGRRSWAALLRAARERFMTRLQHERPALSRSEGGALVMALEQLTGIGAARVQRALYLDVDDRRGFADAIRTLKTMEQILIAAPRSPSVAATRLPSN